MSCYRNHAIIAQRRRGDNRPDGIVDVIRWDEKAGLRPDAIRSQVIDALEAQDIKETGNEEDWHRKGT